MQASEEVVRKLLEEEQKLARSIEHQALQDEELARQILLEEKEQVIKLMAIVQGNSRVTGTVVGGVQPPQV